MVHASEQIIEDIAATLQAPSHRVREANFYQDGQTTPYNDPVSPSYIQELWDSMKKSAHYQERATDIAKFNSVSFVSLYITGFFWKTQNGIFWKTRNLSQKLSPEFIRGSENRFQNSRNGAQFL